MYQSVEYDNDDSLKSSLNEDSPRTYFHQSGTKVGVSYKRWYLKLLAFTGPGILMSIAMIDPGNLEMDIQAGVKFKYGLIWNLVLATTIAFFVQSLAIRLGVVSEYDLATACRMAYSRRVNFVLWIFAEVGVICADIPEVIGTAVALNLLFGVPLYVGVLLAALDTVVIFLVDRYSIRISEVFVGTLVGIIMICLMISMVWSKPDYIAALKGFIPYIQDTNALLISIGLLGSLVMPHNLFFQSSFVKSRDIAKTVEKKEEALLYNHVESAISLVVSLVINISIVILSGTVFYLNEDANLRTAYQFLEIIFNGKVAAILFAISLLASGQCSIITGTYSGQFIMEGFLQMRISLWLRNIITRFIAIIPAFFMVFFDDKGTDLIVIITTCILAFVLPFSLVPLIKITRDESYMGSKFTTSKVAVCLLWILNVLLFVSNISAVILQIVPLKLPFNGAGLYAIISLICLFLILYTCFLCYLIYVPIKKSRY